MDEHFIANQVATSPEPQRGGKGDANPNWLFIPGATRLALASSIPIPIQTSNHGNFLGAAHASPLDLPLVFPAPYQVRGKLQRESRPAQIGWHSK